METDPEQFEQLQRLLKLKRYETPPPRFFASFSQQVVSKISQPEITRGAAWWERLGFDFDLKPALVCVFGIAVCGFLSIGVITSLRLQDETAPRTGTDSMAATSLRSFGEQPPNSVASLEEASASTVPVIEPTPSSSPFNQFAFRAQKVDFKVGFGGN